MLFFVVAFSRERSNGHADAQPDTNAEEQAGPDIVRRRADHHAERDADSNADTNGGRRSGAAFFLMVQILLHCAYLVLIFATLRRSRHMVCKNTLHGPNMLSAKRFSHCISFDGSLADFAGTCGDARMK